MATRPSELPLWDDSDTNLIEPPGAKKSEGWVPGEKPAAQYFNWWMNLVWMWIVWLDTITNSGPQQVSMNASSSSKLITFPMRTVLLDVSGGAFTTTFDKASNFPKGWRVVTKNITFGSGTQVTVDPD